MIYKVLQHNTLNYKKNTVYYFFLAINIEKAITNIRTDEVAVIRSFFCLSETSHRMSSKSSPPPIDAIDAIEEDNKSKNGEKNINSIYLIQYKNSLL
jgi:hypothetical protein